MSVHKLDLINKRAAGMPTATVAMPEPDLRLIAGICAHAADELPRQWFDRERLEFWARHLTGVADELRHANRDGAA